MIMYIITQAHWMHLKRALWPPSPPKKKKNKSVILLLLATNDFMKCYIFSTLCPNGCLCFETRSIKRFVHLFRDIWWQFLWGSPWLLPINNHRLHLVRLTFQYTPSTRPTFSVSITSRNIVIFRTLPTTN